MSKKISYFFKIESKEINSKLVRNEEILDQKSKENIKNNSKIENEIELNIKTEPDQSFTIELPTTKNKQKPSQECKMCKKKFGTLRHFEYHVRNNVCDHNCRFCGKYFSERANLKRHMRDIHTNQLNIEIFKCEICGRNFSRIKDLTQHVELKHHDGQFRKYECDFDGKLFKTRSEIHIHMKTHLSKVKCKICNAELKVSGLTIHNKELHSEQDKISCHKCFKTFVSISRLKLHLKVHERKFECPICNRRLPTFPQLKNHINDIHENPGSHSCEICHKKFNRAENLKVHLKFHDKNRPKPFKCQRCDFATHSKANFNGHLKFHEKKDKIAATMKNPIRCRMCPAILKSKYVFHLHMKSVHIEALYQCDLCGIAMKTKNNIKNHILVHIKNRLATINK